MDFDEFGMPPLDEAGMRLESEIMKLRLNAEYGAVFPEPTPAGTDAGQEYHFLKRVLQLHQRIAETPPKPLKEVLNFGQFRPADSFLDEVELKDALWDALDYLEDSNVIVDFDHEYPDSVMYEFVTRELAELEVIGKPSDDEYICVLYEAFHPNQRADVEDFTEEFLEALFNREILKYRSLFFSARKPPLRLPDTGDDPLTDLILDFHQLYGYLAILDLEVSSVDICNTDPEPEESAAFVYGRLRYEIELSDGATQEVEGPFQLYLGWESGTWYIADFQVPGLIWPEA